MSSLMHPLVQKIFGYWSQAKLAQNAVFNSFWEYVTSVCDRLPSFTLLSQQTDQTRLLLLSYSLSEVMAEGCKPSPSMLFSEWYCRSRGCMRYPKLLCNTVLIVPHSFAVIWRLSVSCDAGIRSLGASVILLKHFHLCLITKQPAQ